MKIKNWESPEKLFEVMNKTGQYTVLRNWEAYFDDLFLPGHGDIDLLCSKKDRNKILRAVGAVRRSNIFNQWNFWVFIADRMVKFDLRVEGDGYYDIKWERDMLSSRRYDKRGFYCLEPEQYFYSLIYHAAYQKREFALDYRERLSEMAENICTADGLKEKLELYMESRGYKYSYVFNPSVYLNLEGVPEDRIERKVSEVVNENVRKTVRKAREIGGGYFGGRGAESRFGLLDAELWISLYGLHRYRSTDEFQQHGERENLYIQKCITLPNYQRKFEKADEKIRKYAGQAELCRMRESHVAA